MDHCRIGSLEKPPSLAATTIYDHCRIGSLEMVAHLDAPW